MKTRQSKLNCWEYMKCGRQPEGYYTKELGVCPATTEEKLDGIHDGVNAGRACWVIEGTICGGKVKGSFAERFKQCEQCDFYALVKMEERADFKLSDSLLRKLKE